MNKTKQYRNLKPVEVYCVPCAAGACMVTSEQQKVIGFAHQAVRRGRRWHVLARTAHGFYPKELVVVVGKLTAGSTFHPRVKRSHYSSA